jgi:hypothetical protein
MSKFSCFFFGNPPNKTISGTADMWELLIANHLDQSLWWTNQKYWAAVKSNLLHSFLEVHNSVAPFTSHGTLARIWSIFWAKPAHFDFFAINKFYLLESHTEQWRCSSTQCSSFWGTVSVGVPPLLRQTEMLIRQRALHISYKILQFLYFFTYFTKHKNSLLAMNYIPSLLWM